MTSAYSINLNFNNTIPVKTDFTFKQGDKGITLNLATTGLDTTGTTAHIVFKRSNGTSVEAELTGQTGPSYSYTILGNEFEIPGVVVADLKLYNGDTQRVSTASFIFLVTGDTMDGVGGGTGGYSDQLEQLSEEFEDTLNEYKDAFGDVGAVNPRGAYDSTADYNVLDLVSYQGSSYLCRTACKNKVPTNTTYWQVFASGSGGVDYNDVSNKPSINSVTLSGNKTTSDLGLFSGNYNDLTNKPTLFSGNYNDLTNKPTIPSDFDDLADVDMAGVTDGQVPTWDETEGKYKPGTPAGGGGTNTNLVMNPWFTVNQRGFTSGSPAINSFVADRWKVTDNYSGNMSATVNANGLSYTGGGVVRQYYESNPAPGKTLCLSVLKQDGTIVSATGTSPSTTPSGDDNYITVSITSGSSVVRFCYRSSMFCIMIDGGSADNVAIKAIKLEIGSTSTLHLDTAPDYSTELLKCQRYFVRINNPNSGANIAVGFTSSTSNAYIPMRLAIAMRIIPSGSFVGAYALSTGGTGQAVSSIAVHTNSSNQELVLKVTSSGLTSNVPVLLYSNANASYIDLNAEL